MIRLILLVILIATSSSYAQNCHKYFAQSPRDSVVGAISSLKFRINLEQVNLFFFKSHLNSQKQRRDRLISENPHITMEVFEELNFVHTLINRAHKNIRYHEERIRRLHERLVDLEAQKDSI